MMQDSRYTVSTENSFVPLFGEENARDEFQTVKRKRNNTDQGEERVSQFMNSSPEDKLNFIFDELRIIRCSQEQMNRHMLNFQQSYRCMNNKMCEVIEVTNQNTSVLKTLSYKSIDLEARSRRNNLVFWGLLENYNENCFQIIRDFIHHHFDLDSDKMYLARAHRLGPRKIGQRNPKRPIIVNFRDFCDTELIMSRAHLLKSTPFSVGYDLPKEINEARKKLWVELKSIKNSKPSAKYQILYPAKLIVDGKLVRDEFPDWGDVLHRSRMTDFAHIDNNFSFDQFSLNTDEQQTRDNSLFINKMNGNSTGARDNLNMHLGRGDVTDTINSSQLKESINSVNDMDCEEQSQEPQVLSMHKPSAVEINSDLPSGAGSSEIIHDASNSVHEDGQQSVSHAQEIFRPYDIDNTITNMQNSEMRQQSQSSNSSNERISRSVVRVDRRKQSTSVPRTRQVSREYSVEKPGQAKNRQTSHSVTVNKTASHLSSDSTDPKHIQSATADASNENARSSNEQI